MELFILILINLVLWAVFFFFFFLYFNQKFKDHWNDQNYLEGIRLEIESLIKELNLTTNRNIDLLEAKILEVKDSLSLTEKGKKALDQEIRKHQQSEEVYLQLGRSHKLSQGNLFPEKDESSPEQKKKETEPSLPSEKEAKPSLDVLKHRVAELHRKGISPTLISKNLDLSLGEVEFIIGLLGT